MTTPQKMGRVLRAAGCGRFRRARDPAFGGDPDYYFTCSLAAGYSSTIVRRDVLRRRDRGSTGGTALQDARARQQDAGETGLHRHVPATTVCGGVEHLSVVLDDGGGVIVGLFGKLRGSEQ